MRDDGIIERIVAFMNQNGGVYSQFQVGITNNISERLSQHGASNKLHVSFNLGSKQDAEDTESYIVNYYKTKGDTGGGAPDTMWIYCFKI